VGKKRHKKRCHWEFIGRVPMPTFYGNGWHEAYIFRCRRDHRELYYMDINKFWTNGPMEVLDFPKVRRRR
jgi:hypothetical protein